MSDIVDNQFELRPVSTDDLERWRNIATESKHSAKHGEFNWPMALLSLTAEIDRLKAPPPRMTLADSFKMWEARNHEEYEAKLLWEKEHPREHSYDMGSLEARSWKPKRKPSKDVPDSDSWLAGYDAEIAVRA